MRRGVVFGLLHAGLAVTRSLGRSGIPVSGISWDPREFGLRSRYLERKHVVGYGHDTCTACQRCGSSVATDPMFGAHFTRNPWPPHPTGTP